MSKPREYYKQKNGEWVQPIKNGYLMACCDCSLVHTVDFRIRDGKVQLRASRHPQATGALRKRNGVTVKH